MEVIDNLLFKNELVLLKPIPESQLEALGNRLISRHSHRVKGLAVLKPGVHILYI